MTTANRRLLRESSIQVSAGWLDGWMWHTCGIKTNGEVVCWGSNYYYYYYGLARPVRERFSTDDVISSSHGRSQRLVVLGQ
jgi:hypothetical protein